MSVVINPIVKKHNFFQSTEHRFFNLFRPIQETRQKHSDFLAYVATPIIDSFILDPVFAIDTAIHLLNALASVGKAAYDWTMGQQHTDIIIDRRSEAELAEAGSHMISAVSAFVAQSLNTILSILALFTRPIASIAHAVIPECNEPQQNFGRDDFEIRAMRF